VSTSSHQHPILPKHCCQYLQSNLQLRWVSWKWLLEKRAVWSILVDKTKSCDEYGRLTQSSQHHGHGELLPPHTWYHHPSQTECNQTNYRARLDPFPNLSSMEMQHAEFSVNINSFELKFKCKWPSVLHTFIQCLGPTLYSLGLTTSFWVHKHLNYSKPPFERPPSGFGK